MDSSCRGGGYCSEGASSGLRDCGVGKESLLKDEGFVSACVIVICEVHRVVIWPRMRNDAAAVCPCISSKDSEALKTQVRARVYQHMTYAQKQHEYVSSWKLQGSLYVRVQVSGLDFVHGRRSSQGEQSRRLYYPEGCWLQERVCNGCELQWLQRSIDVPRCILHLPLHM